MNLAHDTSEIWKVSMQEVTISWRHTDTDMWHTSHNCMTQEDKISWRGTCTELLYTSHQLMNKQNNVTKRNHYKYVAHFTQQEDKIR